MFQIMAMGLFSYLAVESVILIARTFGIVRRLPHEISSTGSNVRKDYGRECRSPNIREDVIGATLSDGLRQRTCGSLSSACQAAV